MVPTERLALTVAGASVAVLWSLGVGFGANTRCTNDWSCSVSTCSPCRVVSVASVGGAVAAIAIGVVVVLDRRLAPRVAVTLWLVVAIGTVALAMAYSLPE